MRKTKFKINDKVICSKICPIKHRFIGVRVIHSINRPRTIYKKLNYLLQGENKIYFANELALFS